MWSTKLRIRQRIRFNVTENSSSGSLAGCRKGGDLIYIL